MCWRTGDIRFCELMYGMMKQKLKSKEKKLVKLGKVLTKKNV